jgi:hypothetical protein
MLELDHPSMLGLNICEVLRAIVGYVNNFLPSLGKFRFPCAVPRAFILPPRVT